MADYGKQLVEIAEAIAYESGIESIGPHLDQLLDRGYGVVIDHVEYYHDGNPVTGNWEEKKWEHGDVYEGQETCVVEVYTRLGKITGCSIIFGIATWGVERHYDVNVYGQTLDLLTLPEMECVIHADAHAPEHTHRGTAKYPPSWYSEHRTRPWMVFGPNDSINLVF